MADDRKRVISRRELLKGASAAGAAAIFPGRAEASEPAAPLPPTIASAPRPRRLEVLTGEEAETLEAIMARLIPSDELGPGAVEAGVINYIDRALGGFLSDQREDYRLNLAAFDRYCRMSRGAPFTELATSDQDSVLIDVEAGSATGSGAGFNGSSAAFFRMVQGHTWQGMFGDPFYGGNANFVGWDLIGYPGVRTAVSAEDQRLLEAGQLQPNHRSAYDNEMFEKAVALRATNDEVNHGD